MSFINDVLYTTLQIQLIGFFLRLIESTPNKTVAVYEHKSSSNNLGCPHIRRAAAILWMGNDVATLQRKPIASKQLPPKHTTAFFPTLYRLHSTYCSKQLRNTFATCRPHFLDIYIVRSPSRPAINSNFDHFALLGTWNSIISGSISDWDEKTRDLWW